MNVRASHRLPGAGLSRAYRLDPLLAEFDSPTLEQEFRTFIRDTRVRDTRTALGLAAFFYVLFAFTDYLAIQDGSDYTSVFMLRLCVGIVGLACALLAERYWRQLVNGVIPTLVVSLAMVSLLMITVKRPYELGWNGMSMLLVLIGAYAFIPNRFITSMVAAVTGSLGFLWLAVLYFQPSFNEVLYLITLLLVVNIIGAMTGYRSSRLQHEAYVQLLVQREAGAVLSTEARARVELESELRQMSEQDALTRLASRQHFFERAERMLEHAAGDTAPLSLLMIDVDYFRQINSTYGHVRGDALLRGLAEVCRAHMAPGDLGGRLGGEEFAIMLPGVDLAQATAKAEQLRLAIQRAPVDIKDAGLNCTVSIGVAQWARGEGITSLLRRTDHALSAAKYRGRNRVEAADGALQADAYDADHPV